MAEHASSGGESLTVQKRLRGGCLIGGATGEVMRAALGREALQPGRGGLVMLVMSGAGKTRCGESPPRNSEYLPNLLKMVVDGLGVECAPNKASISKNSFVVMEN